MTRKAKAAPAKATARQPTDAPTDARAREVDPDERLRRICQRIREGSSVDAACWREGIDPDAVRSTMRRHPDVRAQVEAARAEAEDMRRQRLAMLIEEGRPTAGATWELERLHRSTYHLPSKVDLSASVTSAPATSEQARRLADAAAEHARLLEESEGGEP